MGVACERRRISGCRFSPPKNSVYETELQNDFRDVTTLVFFLANESRVISTQFVL